MTVRVLAASRGSLGSGGVKIGPRGPSSIRGRRSAPSRDCLSARNCASHGRAQATTSPGSPRTRLGWTWVPPVTHTTIQRPRRRKARKSGALSSAPHRPIEAAPGSRDLTRIRGASILVSRCERSAYGHAALRHSARSSMRGPRSALVGNQGQHAKPGAHRRIPPRQTENGPVDRAQACGPHLRKRLAGGLWPRPSPSCTGAAVARQRSRWTLIRLAPTYNGPSCRHGL